MLFTRRRDIPHDVRPLPRDRIQPSQTATRSTGSRGGGVIGVCTGGAVTGAVVGGVFPVNPAVVSIGLGHRHQRDSRERGGVVQRARSRIGREGVVIGLFPARTFSNSETFPGRRRLTGWYINSRRLFVSLFIIPPPKCDVSRPPLPVRSKPTCGGGSTTTIPGESLPGSRGSWRWRSKPGALSSATLFPIKVVLS